MQRLLWPGRKVPVVRRRPLHSGQRVTVTVVVGPSTLRCPECGTGAPIAKAAEFLVQHARCQPPRGADW